MTEQPPRTITSNTGISIALVVTIVTGIVANLWSMASLRERLSTFEVKLEGVVEGMREVKTRVDAAHTTTRVDVHNLSLDLQALRDRVTKLEAHTK